METTELGKIANIVSGTARPKVETGTIPVYGGNGILGYTNVSNYSGPMICVGRVGAYCGAISFERKNLWLSDNALGITTKNGVDILFLRYFLEALDLNRVHVGAAQPVITQGVLRKLPLKIPNLESQKKIAKTLEILTIKFLPITKLSKLPRNSCAKFTTIGLCNLIFLTRTVTHTNHLAERWSMTKYSSERFLKAGALRR